MTKGANAEELADSSTHSLALLAHPLAHWLILFDTCCTPLIRPFIHLSVSTFLSTFVSTDWGWCNGRVREVPGSIPGLLPVLEFLYQTVSRAIWQCPDKPIGSQF